VTPGQAAAERYARNKRYIFAMCNAFGLTRADRIHVATCVLNRNVESFADLSPDEVSRLRDALYGATLVCHVQIEKRQAKAAMVTATTPPTEGDRT
jgi:hypothetical protein